MAWDHPRARNPLNAISAQWSQRSGIDVHWDARSLKEFEDQPLEELANRYDLVLIDHPFVGTAATSGLIVAVDEWADMGYLEDQRRHSVGPSYRSYTWNNQQWALAIDAAAQVGALRPDLVEGTGIDAASSDWTKVLLWTHELRKAPARVAMPLNPNHAYCAFLALGVATLGPSFWSETRRFDAATAGDVVHFLRRMASDLHPLSRTSDPIGISDAMCGSDTIVYVPLMFGYSSYARPGFRTHRIKFQNAPRGSSGYIGSTLGGVGIALSERSELRDAAADLARLLVSGEVQSNLYVEAGGQPGHSAAWESDVANSLVGGFFRDTRATMDAALLRPRVRGHRRFQEEAGLIIHDMIWQESANVADGLSKLQRLAEDLLGNDEFN